MRGFLAKKIGLFIFFILGACIGSDKPVVEEVMSALVAGDIFTLSEDFDTSFGRKIASNQSTTILVIQATNNLGQGFIFRISPYEGLGTYIFGPASGTDHLATWIDDAKDLSYFTTGFEDTLGQFVVTEDLEDRIGGTFEFNAKSSETSPVKKIETGVFKISLQ